MDVPWRTHLRAVIHPRGHAAVSGLDIQRVKTPLDIYVAVAGSQLRAPVQVAALNMPVTRVQANVPLGPLYGDVPVSGAHIQAASNRVGFHRPVSGGHFEVRVLRHMHFHADVGTVEAKTNMKAARLRSHRDAIAGLGSLNVQIPVQLVSRVFHAHLYLLDIARGHPHGSIIGLHMHSGMAAYRKGLYHLVGPRRW